ncbi:MAG: hypothetical protein JRN44_00560 [Nitrososphaerota archaeon]|nr:hypothetical protein [Nitrososphaerota archaeon]MDG6941830.1 hypothetical protein [Nitrososphaerota archaeon]MDG6946997.1 hypothetical protein [Nitrososphaerota archaeon]MDG6950591.1 hypothetical protein [Nitrososphaerota archaeon]
MKSDVSPMWLTYHMVDWKTVSQEETELRCTLCGGRLMKTEVFTGETSQGFVGYVCHADRHVTWVKES